MPTSETKKARAERVILTTLLSRGGTATRDEIHETGAASGEFTPAELEHDPTKRKRPAYMNQLGWPLTELSGPDVGLIDGDRKGTWWLTEPGYAYATERWPDSTPTGPTAMALEPALRDPDTVTAEGRVLLRVHRIRERNRDVVAAKKREALATGRFFCEVCHLRPDDVYPEHAVSAVIECHHVAPLASAGERETRLADLALVCCNCHSAIHAGGTTRSLDALRAEMSRERRA